jgi:tRNA(fMet)-specific endonuclease VapC
VLSRVRILSFNIAIARYSGAIEAALITAGRKINVAEIHLAATALHHDMEVVTGNLDHFGLIPGLKIEPVLADARRLPH